MAMVFTVQADSRVECEGALARLCADYGLEPRLLPMQIAGTDRWMARASAIAAGSQALAELATTITVASSQ